MIHSVLETLRNLFIIGVGSFVLYLMVFPPLGLLYIHYALTGRIWPFGDWPKWYWNWYREHKRRREEGITTLGL